MKIAFITNFCPHYRIKTFETLSTNVDVMFYFYSVGKEWYWGDQDTVRKGKYRYRYLPGLTIGNTRVTPALPINLWQNSYDLFIKCINGRFALPIVYIIARLKRKPFILWTGIWFKLRTPFHMLFYPITKYIYHHSDAIVVYGNHVKKFLQGEGVPRQRIFIAPHAIDNHLYSKPASEVKKRSLLSELGIGNDIKIVLYLGRLETSKGVDCLIKAISLIQKKDVVLLIVGQGSDRHRLQKIVEKEKPLANIHFIGHVIPEETVLYYSIAWVLVLPSITTNKFKEPWGLVVNEAFNQGVPVIASDAVGAAAGGLIVDHYNGLIFREKSEIELAKALQLILDDPQLRERLGGNALQAVSTWNNDLMVKGFLDAISFVQSLRR